MCHPEAPPGSTRPHPATARSRRRPPADFCGLFCGLFCGRLCVVNTSAARDSEASRDPSPAELIASDSRQAARASPAKPPRRPQCAGIARHQISNAQAACPPRMRRGCARAGAQLRLRGGGALSCRSSSRKRPVILAVSIPGYTPPQPGSRGRGGNCAGLQPAGVFRLAVAALTCSGPARLGS